MTTRFLTAFVMYAAFAAMAGAPVRLSGQAAQKAPPPAPKNPPPDNWIDPRNPPKEDPNWKAPVAADGHPSLEGRWGQVSSITNYSLEDPEGDRDEHTRIGGQRAAVGRPIMDPVDGNFPYQPWARKFRDLLIVNHRKPTTPEYLDPVARGFEDGMPRVNWGGFQLLQQKDQIIFSYDYFHQFRVVPTDGRPPLPSGVKLWNGSSRGRWEGNTFVVDVDNLNDQSWIDLVGGFHSDAMHLVEHWTRVSPTHLVYLVTATDPKVLTQPMTLRIDFHTQPDDEQWEQAVWEGNKLGGLGQEFWGAAKQDPAR